MSWTRNLPVALPVGAIALVLLAGCMAPAQPSPAPSDTQRFALAIDPDAVFDELGPVPPDETPSAERLAAYRQTVSDQAWNGIVSSYPDAVRATAEPVYLPGADAHAAAVACLADQGLALPDGGTDDLALVKASSLAQYACSQLYVDERGPQLSEKQAGYLYDYQTRFVLPCYAEKGHADETTPIGRDDFVESWPFQRWTPTPSDIDMMTLEYDQLELMCPGIPDAWS